MEKNESVSITVILSGRPYPLSVAPNEATLIREAAKELNDRISQFQLKYARVDKRDAMAMTLLNYARETMLLRQAAQADADNFLELSRFLDAVLSETHPAE